MALLRLFLIAFVVLTVIYVSLSFYSRARARDRLEAEWDTGDIAGPRETYVQQGLTTYDSSLRRKLILGVYIVPMTLVCLTIYLVNFA
ncbi:hypothetical protein [uncultured Tateyamaria sp.]|uniref:hypothetical protein n=1 Tax=uncultured Tateyamaria sp. TaxID=455651 RepID=UPI002636B7A7|nr:hypothetical protein [uncultured Tateyamaria sp.]